jgi:hypothetical protein
MTVKASEIFGYARDLERMWRVGTRFLPTESRTREKFIRVGKMLRIKGAADELHSVQVGLGVHIAHGLLFFLANTMFSSDGSSMIDAKMKNTNGEIDG